MTTMASQVTSLTVVYSTVYPDADQIKHQSSASLAFVWGIHRNRRIPRTKGQLRGKCFHLMASSWGMVSNQEIGHHYRSYQNAALAGDPRGEYAVTVMLLDLQKSTSAFCCKKTFSSTWLLHRGCRATAWIRWSCEILKLDTPMDLIKPSSTHSSKAWNDGGVGVRGRSQVAAERGELWSGVPQTTKCDQEHHLQSIYLPNLDSSVTASELIVYNGSRSCYWLAIHEMGYCGEKYLVDVLALFHGDELPVATFTQTWSDWKLRHGQ